MNKDSYHSMKRGLALSLTVHAILFIWGVSHFNSSVSLPQQLEAIPITLAPLSQEFASQQGASNAPVRAIPSEKPTIKPQEKEEARHIGEGQIDSIAPFKPNEKPKLVETTPPPSGEKKTPEEFSPLFEKQEFSRIKMEDIFEKVTSEVPLETSKVVEKATPEVPLETSKVSEKVTPEVPLETSKVVEKATSEAPLETSKVSEKVTPEVPLETQKKKEVTSLQKLVPTLQKVPVEKETIFQKSPKIALPEKSPFPHFKPKTAKQSVLQNTQAKKNSQTTDQTIEDILAMEEKDLLNRARTQGGGAKRSHTPEALGARKKISDTTKMAQTLVSIAGGCIQRKLKLVALGGDLKNRPVVRLRFYLDREGMVIGDPIVDALSGAESQQAIMIRQVYAAVFSCQPYTELPRDQYDLWGQGFDFNVDPLQETMR